MLEKYGNGISEGLLTLVDAFMNIRHLALNLLAVSPSVFVVAPQYAAVKVDLSTAFNIKAASTGPHDPLANFDGSRRAYPVEWLPNVTSYNHSGIEFLLPPFHDPNAFDVIDADGQVLSVPSGNYHSFHSLMTTTGYGSEAINITFNFQDGTSEIRKFTIGPWWSSTPVDGPIHTPYHYANPGLDDGMTISYNVTSIEHASSSITNDKQLISITLPSADWNVRIFSISLVPAASVSEGQLPLVIQNVRSTTKWLDSNSTSRIQQIEITINNLAFLSYGSASWITAPLSVSLSSDSIVTIVPGTLKRLRSNDQTTVIVGIVNAGAVRVGSIASVKVILKDNSGKLLTLSNGDTEWSITAGIPKWQANDESLATHEAPDWFDDAKFGIFIHYGLYSIPAWAPTGKQYPAWYNWDFHNPPDGDSPTRDRHRIVYGVNVTYDDFLVNWTATTWNPDEWTDLFANSGAKYFVFVTKHHDGIVLFDTNSTDRTTVKLGPKRNFVKELLNSAKSRHPDLRRGLYFSLPEWFNPAYGPYGKPSWPGHPALNAFTGQCCDPYTGSFPVNDFIQDIQKPQMEALFYEYDTEILWCDIGFASAFPQIGADWYNYAASQGRQVVMNNRCGANQSDFVTPEYATFGSVATQKWETSHGMDPYAYAFNSDTPLDKYENSSTLIHELVDIVSKGGNLLLGVGPKEDGTIIAQMTDPLLQVGKWLQTAGEAIYGTRPWWLQNQETTSSTDIRFTTTTDAFYIIALAKPSGGLNVTAPVPIASGDQVTLLGGNGAPLSWVNVGRLLTVYVSDSELDKINLPAWAFKISYAT